MSPTVLRHGPYRFFFISREEPRMHIHVTCNEGEAKFWLEPEVELAYKHKLSRKQLGKVSRSSSSIVWRLPMPGAITSDIEVTHISKHGLWLLAGAEELFLPFDDFPWFRDASVKDVLNVEEPTQGHYYWPALDVDLSLNIIRDPARYPLKAKSKR